MKIKTKLLHVCCNFSILQKKWEHKKIKFKPRFFLIHLTPTPLEKMLPKIPRFSR